MLDEDKNLERKESHFQAFSVFLISPNDKKYEMYCSRVIKTLAKALLKVM